MANSRSFLPTRVLTFVRFTVSVLCVAFLCGSSLWADYNAATADLGADWTVTNSNGVTLDGSVLNYAKHTGALTISSDPTFTLTNGAVFEESGVITSNKKAIVVQGGGTLKITSASDLNSQAKGLWGFYFYDGSVVDTSGAGFMCLNGTSNNVRFYEDGELIVGTNMWTKTTTEIHAYAGANAKLTQSTAAGISDASGLNLSTSGSVTFNVEQNATLTSTAKIYDEGSTGSIAKTGAGSLTLSGSVTYTVPTTVSDGTLLFSCDTLPKSVMTVSGGTLVLGTAGNSITALDGTSIKADGGAVRVDGNLNINSGVLTAQGDWTGNGAINVKTGTQLRINSSFNYPNDITLKGGILRNAKDVPEATIYAPVNVESDSTMQAGWSKVFSLNGALKGSGNITIPEDSGYVRFSGDASAYTGSLTLASKGKIRIGVHGTDTTNSKAFIGPNAITLNGGTIMNTNNNLTVNNDLILSSESYFQAGWSKNLTLSGSITGSGKFHVLSDSGWVIAATTCPDNSYTGSVHTDNDSNPYGLLKLGANNPFGDNAGEARIWGTLDMYGYSQTFAGVANSDTTTSGKVKGTAASVLTLKLNNNASKVYGGVFEGALSLVLTGDGTGTQILKQDPAYKGSTTVEAGTLQLDAGGTLYNLSGAGKVAYGSKTLTLSNSADTTFSGSLSGSGDLVFASNASSWIVMATTCDDSFTGRVRIYYDANSNGASQGRVRLGRDNAFGLNAGQADVYGMLDMNGYSQTFKGLNSDADKSPVYNNTETLSTLTLNTTGKDLTFRSSIQGNIALVVTGTGKQTLNKAPEYTGSTTVESGTLVLSAGGSLNNLSGSGTIDTEGQALTLNNTTPTEFSGVISDTGYVTKTGAEKLTLSGANDYSGGTSISEGRIVLTGNGTLGTNNVTIEENSTLEFAHESEQNVSNYIYGNGSVIKSGSGVLTLSNGSYLGETTVSGGTLIVPSTASLATSKVTVKSEATFQTGGYVSGVDIKGGNLVIGDTGQTNYVSFGSLTLEGGKINFDFYDSSNIIYDKIGVNSASLSSGVINLTFNDSSADDWRSVITDYYAGSLPLISGIFENYSTAFNTNALDVYVNGSPSTDWKLTADLYGLYLSPKGSSGDSWYYANTGDITLDSWTIDGTDKQGVKFTEGGDSATFAGGVTMSANGTFDIGSKKTLTVSNVISDSGSAKGSLTKTGEGTLELSGNNTFTGGTTVSDGTLTLNLTFNDGTKGNLAIGSTVTVDGATSVLAGHGDILGYSSGSVGTINLQNGGTLHNDSTGNHITVGAVINMTNGIISSEEGWGNGTFGNFVFDNAINVLGGKDNEISAWKITLRQYTGTSDEEVGGKITVVGDAKLTISSQIAAHNSAELVPLVKLGDGELVLSGDCTYTTGTYVYGGKLTLTKRGEKGTLASGSAVTVDGATSILAGHGDILGYSGSTVGTINLENGGTLYNDSTDSHITVGAAINMKHGHITAVENADGNGTFGNYVFDNAINALEGMDNEINVSRITIRQYGGTPGNGGGKFTVADGAKLTVSSVIAGGDVPLVKLGDGELVLSASNTYSKGTTLSKGKITLTKTGTLGTGPVENSALIEFAQNSDVTIGNAISGTGSVIKTGTGEVTMSGDSDYTGGTTVNAGKLTLTKRGEKGTLAKDGVVTVDGATSILAGHGDIFGYGADTLGTVNLQNGGKLHNDSTDNHITVGAAINMNSGTISAEEGWGNGTFGNFVFDNAINVLGGEDNEISAWKITLRQYGGTPGNGGGKFTVADSAKLTVSSIIRSEGVPLIKSGEGELVLSGENTLTTGVFVNAGKLTLTKKGQKGTLAPGSAVTVDGETSILAGHGDILGYSGDTVGSVTLQNGGTLYNDATSEQAAHITVGAEINMNNGFITADPDAQGSDTYGNYVFDNAINVTGGKNNAISANQITLRQYDGTPGNAGGKFTVADDAKLTISSLIKDPNGYFVTLNKLGDGELVLNAANTYSKGTTISEGMLTLAEAGTLGSGNVTIAENAALVFAHDSDQTFNNAVSGAGTVSKIGSGKLKIDATENQFQSSQFTVEAGELDFRGNYNGAMYVNSGATLSPGNSVGDMTVYGNVTIDGGATGLFEFSAFNADKDQQVFDQMFVTGGSFTLVPGSTIKLSFLSGDASDWANADEPVYQLVYDDGFVAQTTDMSQYLETQYQGVFELQGTPDGLFLIGRSGDIPVPGPDSGVPEPSTWALLALGVCGLLYLRKRVRN